MSAHHVPDWVPDRSGGTGVKDNGQFATWLALISFTFFLGTFLAANVYLRGWSPEKFTINFNGDYNLPAITTILLIVAGVIVLAGANAFRKGSWKSFQALMVLSMLVFAALAITQIRLLVFTYGLGPAAWTANLMIYAIQFALSLVCIGFLVAIMKFYSERNEKALRRLVPASMSVFMYTIIIGVIVLVLTDMITVAQFTQWCGTKIGLVK
ncbi:MAG: hypothetical protein ACXVP5_00890 [Tumebacillaceae bacterium]